ncbi:hypothetical protein Mgra_00004744 [Meloidogyne graminicola]|uniref:Uncharacterized protein n=1 Tax=Meloidogyne graminicola TaxID=189291 RepID=A0A8S9ZRH3_9BILA|nr:hypothetical protein Mgra_00004744 [Meloidogyne graminicola]
MTLLLFDIISQLDYWICLFFGFNLNLFLIWLILFKTPKEMFIHSRILIQNCILDIIYLIIECFGQSVKLK